MKYALTRSVGTIVLLCNVLAAQSVEKPVETCSRAKSIQKLVFSPRSVTDSQAKVDMLYYRLDLDLDPDNAHLQGNVIARAVVVESGLDTLDLDLSTFLNVTAVRMDQEPIAFEHNSSLLRMALPQVADVGDTLEFRVDYAGTPPATGFGSFNFDEYAGRQHIWTLSEPYGARDWWPCKDDPEDKADSVDIIVRIPEDLVVASNGTQVSFTKLGGGRVQYHWHESYPISTYLVSLAIYPYRVWNDYYRAESGKVMPITFYVFPDRYELVQPNYLLTKSMISVFAEQFGEYPFLDEKYGHAEFAWGGGMEHQTLTSLGGYSEGLIAHELAHQWWGDMITCASFHHIWLNEGFATYSVALWQEAKAGPAAYNFVMNSRAYYGGGTIYVENPARVGDIFNYWLSYAKASWVLHMLRHVTGDSTFFTILKVYGDHPNHKYGTATTEEFRSICEDISGLDLEPFFEQWIYGSYFPQYRVTYRHLGDRLNVELDQVQTEGSVFQMPIDLRITTTNSVIDTVIRNTLVHEEYDIPMPPGEALLSLNLDPDNWILKQVEYLSIDGTIPVPLSFSLMPVYPNPFNTSAVIRYELPVHSNVRLAVYDIMGREIALLGVGDRGPGVREVHWNASNVPSGIYFIQMVAGEFRQVQKVMVLE